ncbi:hypothetical protein GCM10011386_12770 [Parapedobacter defluvii]|uniref:DUF4333 domain-containing protein n=1 Tax=Parapedobacter defluvii TaxID=2045106 RepID=A0ABQ1LC99_9SPHI|nr:hypothetical protein [Parapedobacter defluvii]GGC22293.1 hypothetical protein GCM10011386_12770 [Parapedobacter defluvii]
MIKLFKNKVDFTGVAVLLMAFFVAVGFKAAERYQGPDWYAVTVTDPSQPNSEAFQQIQGLYPGGTPTTPCDQPTADTVCAVQLTLGEDESLTFRVTIQAVRDMIDDDNADISIGSKLYKPEDED